MPPRNKKAKSVLSLNKSQLLPTLPTTPRQCIDKADSLLKQQKLLVQWREARPTGPNGTRYEEELVDKIFYTIFRQTARPIQVKVVCQIIFERRDCILTARTGLGKSRPLQAVSIMLPNTISLIIIPLDKIGQEQVASLERLCQTIEQLDPKSATRNQQRSSENPKNRCIRPLFVNASAADQDPQIWKKILDFQYTHILMSPEQAIGKNMIEILHTPSFAQRVVLVAVDEAHLVRRWGQDFRPCYAQLSALRLRLGQSESAHPWLACTATLDTDSFRKLQIGCCFKPDVKRFRASIDRPEIAYCFVPLSAKSLNKFTDLAFVIQPAKGKGNGVQAFQHIPKTVIFIDSRKKIRTAAKIIRQWLSLHHPEATTRDINNAARWYHSTTGKIEQENIFSSFSQPESRVRIVVATESLGMGVDLDDVEVVVQYGFPIDQDLETVIQRFGRAARGRGRSGKAILLYEKTRILKAQQMLPPSQFEEADDMLIAEDDSGAITSNLRGDEDYPIPSTIIPSIELEARTNPQGRSQTQSARTNPSEGPKNAVKAVQPVLVKTIQAATSGQCARRIILMEYEEDLVEYERIPPHAYNKQLCCNGCNPQLFRLFTPPDKPDPLRSDPLKNSRDWQKACFSYLESWCEQQTATAFNDLPWRPDADAFISQWQLRYLCSRLHSWSSVDELREVLLASTANHPAYVWDKLDRYGQGLIEQKGLAVTHAHSVVQARVQKRNVARDVRIRSNRSLSRSRSVGEERTPSVPPAIRAERLLFELQHRRSGSPASRERQATTPLQEEHEAIDDAQSVPTTPFQDSGFGSSFGSSVTTFDAAIVPDQSSPPPRPPAQQYSMYDESIFNRWPLSSSAPQLSTPQVIPLSPTPMPLSEVQPNQQTSRRSRARTASKRQLPIEPQRSMKRRQL